MPRIFISDLSTACGQTLAKYFLAKGVKVAAGCAAKAPKGCEQVELYQEDTADAAACMQLVDKLRASGGVDALITTAKHIERMSVEHGTEEAFDRIMRANTKTAFMLSRYVGELMAETGKGAIVFIGSIHGEKPTGASLGFSCSMGAIKMLNRECSLQLGRKGVHCVLVEMGPVAGDDALFDSTLTPIYDGFEQSIPRKTACTYEELSELVDTCIHMPMLNGADIRADGGFMMKYGDR